MSFRFGLHLHASCLMHSFPWSWPSAFILLILVFRTLILIVLVFYFSGLLYSSPSAFILFCINELRALVVLTLIWPASRIGARSAFRFASRSRDKSSESGRNRCYNIFFPALSWTSYDPIILNLCQWECGFMSQVSMDFFFMISPWSWFSWSETPWYYLHDFGLEDSRILDPRPFIFMILGSNSPLYSCPLGFSRYNIDLTCELRPRAIITQARGWRHSCARIQSKNGDKEASQVEIHC